MKKFRFALLMVPVFLLGMTLNSMAADPAKQEAQQIQKDITQTLQADAKFTSLLAALKTAQLVETLQGPGPFTVFAPTDDAFKKLPPGSLDALLKDAPELKKVLLYHVVPGQKPSKEVMTLKSLPTAHGEDLTIEMKDGKALIEGAQLVQTDIPTKNGTIHVIDTVMMPKAKVTPIK